MMIKSILCSLLLLCGSVDAGMLTDPSESDTTSAADTLANEENKLLALPIVFYSPETKLALGVYPIYVFRVSPGCRPSNISLPVFYTIKRQFAIALQPEIYLSENLYSFSGNLYYEKWPDVYYGIGKESSVENKEDYTAKNSGIYVNLKRKLIYDFYAGINFDYSQKIYTRFASNGSLKTDNITGSESGHKTGIGFSISWDDRDNIIYPGNGNYDNISAGYYGKRLDSDYTFNGFTVDLRKYLTLRDSDVLAVQAFAVSLEGDPPFWTMPRIGDVIRGYEPTRFIDRCLLAFQAEYRIHPIWRRWGLALFAGTAAIENNFSNIESGDFKSAAGLGIRYLFLPAENMNIRVDFALGSESMEMYIGAGEYF